MEKNKNFKNLLNEMEYLENRRLDLLNIMKKYVKNPINKEALFFCTFVLCLFISSIPIMLSLIEKGLVSWSNPWTAWNVICFVAHLLLLLGISIVPSACFLYAIIHEIVINKRWARKVKVQIDIVQSEWQEKNISEKISIVQNVENFLQLCKKETNNICADENLLSSDEYYKLYTVLEECKNVYIQENSSYGNVIYFDIGAEIKEMSLSDIDNYSVDYEVNEDIIEAAYIFTNDSIKIQHPTPIKGLSEHMKSKEE